MATRPTRRTDRGFSFIELLAYMAIVALLFAAAVPQFRAYQQRAVVSNLKDDVHTASLSAEASRIETASMKHSNSGVQLVATRAASAPSDDFAAIVSAVRATKVSDDATTLTAFDAGGGEYTIVGANPAAPSFNVVFSSAALTDTSGAALTPGLNLVKDGAVVAHPGDGSETEEPPSDEPSLPNPVEPAGKTMTLTLASAGTCAATGLNLTGAVDAQIEWGDGTPAQSATGATAHSYTDGASSHQVSITGTFERFGGELRDINQNWTGCILSVDRWDQGTGTTSLKYGFMGAKELRSVPASIPSTISDFTNTFYKATVFNDPAVGQWKMTQAQTLAGMFASAPAFNQPLNAWDTSNVTNMSSLFNRATAFNQDLDRWNTSKVTTFGSMFEEAKSFNGVIGTWDTSKSLGFGLTFAGATSFNQPIGNWDTSSAKTFYGTFSLATAFNQPLGKWNVSNAPDLQGMFSGASSFDQDLSGWSPRSGAAVTSFADGSGLSQAHMPRF